ncbi:MAG: XRE family transcriptional regulator [Alphaproteobacteria bacterium]|nr:MAG: XRE family transcriptional regulator [Alphaproteobacteria bacterium]
MNEEGEEAAGKPLPAAVLIDRWVGRRLVELCQLSAARPEEVAGLLGISVAELEDYRNGSAPVPASVLFLAARRFEVAMDYFFADLSEGKDGHALSASCTPVDAKKRPRKSP